MSTAIESPRAAAPAPAPLRPVVLRAAADAVPVIAAYVPFGLTLGATLAASGISPLVAWASSSLLFGGAAQLLAVQLLGSGASIAVVVAARNGRPDDARAPLDAAVAGVRERGEGWWLPERPPGWPPTSAASCCCAAASPTSPPAAHPHPTSGSLKRAEDHHGSGRRKTRWRAPAPERMIGR